MGRLTLNVLLSFAQFERELIGRRRALRWMEDLETLAVYSIVTM